MFHSFNAPDILFPVQNKRSRALQHDGSKQLGGERALFVPSARQPGEKLQRVPLSQNYSAVDVSRGHLLTVESQPQAALADINFLGDEPLVIASPVNAKKSLQEEIPAALDAYDRVLEQLRMGLRQFIISKKIDIAGFESDVAALVASLQRNKDALLCVSKLRPARGYVYSHCVNVCIYLVAFTLQSGKSNDEALAAGMAGLFHDIGMTMLPLSILQSRKTLTPTEQTLVRRHPVLACDLFASVPGFCKDVFRAALEHHEHYDGSGYPNKLSGSAISPIGHLTAIASAFDAISSNRHHKSPLHPHEALGEMFKRRSKQFHPVLAEGFVRMVGIYPVGTIVELQDGYRAVVSGSAPDAPLRPRITLVMDPAGRPMIPVELEMKRESVADIVKCLTPKDIGIDPVRILGFPVKDDSTAL